jgi:hypothetical protein
MSGLNGKEELPAVTDLKSKSASKGIPVESQWKSLRKSDKKTCYFIPKLIWHIACSTGE